MKHYLSGKFKSTLILLNCNLVALYKKMIIRKVATKFYSRIKLKLRDASFVSETSGKLQWFVCFPEERRVSILG